MKKSLGLKFIILLTISIIIAMLIFGFIYYFIEKSSLKSELKEESEITIDKIANFIEIPLWNFIVDQIDNIIKQEIKNKNIHSIIVYDDEEEIVTGFIKDKENNIVTYNTENINSFMVISKDIHHDNKYIGKLKIHITDRNIKSQLFILIQGFIIQTIILIIVVSVVSIIIFNINVVKRINKIIDDTSIEGDLTKKIEIKSKDELGVLGEHFNGYISILNNMIKHIKISVSNTKHRSSNLMSASEESSQTLKQMEENIQSTNTSIANLDDEISLSNKSFKDISKVVSVVNQKMNSHSTIIEESSNSIEDILKKISNIASESEAKLQLFNKLENIANSGEKEMKKTIETIKNVNSSTGVIIEMTDVINSIAKKTNLLAMNASIEAAHAGKHGKGFAVVAEEIRKLAETTSINAHDISETLNEITNEIQISEQSTTNTGELFLKIVKIIKELAIDMMNMKKSMEDLINDSTLINNSLEDLIKATKAINKSTGDMNENLSVITSSMGNIHNISNNTRREIVSISTGIEQLMRAISNLVDESSHNNTSIMELEELVNKLKVDDFDDDNSQHLLY